jgi:hypothetical protein
MAPTLEELVQRIAALEQEVRHLRELIKKRPGEETAAERGARMLREAKASQPALNIITAKVFEKLGIKADNAMSLEQLHAEMIARGIKPEDNIFSREIMAMREE